MLAMPYLTTLATQQADLLMSDSLQLEEVIRRSLLKNGENDLPLPADTLKVQESRDIYEFPALETLADRLAALRDTHDALMARKIHLQELISDYNHYVATQAQRAENNNRNSDDRKLYLERTLDRQFHNDRNEEHLRELEEVNGEIEGIEEEIAAQESAVKEHRIISGENGQEDTIMTEVECLVCFENAADTITPGLCQHSICTTCAHTYIFSMFP